MFLLAGGAAIQTLPSRCTHRAIELGVGPGRSFVLEETRAALALHEGWRRSAVVAVGPDAGGRGLAAPPSGSDRRARWLD